jgi:hypothetical protein
MQDQYRSGIRAQNRYRPCAECLTSETEARIWDSQEPQAYSETLNDQELREKLQDLQSLWQVSSEDEGHHKPRTVLLTVPVDETKHTTIGIRAIRIQDSSLYSVMRFAGVDERACKNFWNSIMPTVYSYSHYDDGEDVPTSMTILFRCPRMSNAVIGVIKIQFRTRNCFAFIATVNPEDAQYVVSECMAHVALVRKHPLYLLTFILDHRFLRWTEWFAVIWTSLSEIESTTNMTHPLWRVSVDDPERLRYLSDPDRLLAELHATHLEFCHSQTVMSFALKFTAFCTQAVADIEDGRGRLGYNILSPRDRRGLEEQFAAILDRCRAMKERLDELARRLEGQINLSFNLIAQRDSKINFAIAKLMANDSRTVKAIGVLTLVFLPATFLAVRCCPGQSKRSD